MRFGVWRQQPTAFFDEAIIEADGTRPAPPTQLQGGDRHQLQRPVGLSSAGRFAGQHHRAVVPGQSLRQSSQSRRSPAYLDQAIRLCRQGGFRRVLVRGDTDFSQSAHLDRWDRQGVRFIFGIDASPKLWVGLANLPKSSWEKLDRRSPHQVQTRSRAKPDNVKEKIVGRSRVPEYTARGTRRRDGVPADQVRAAAIAWWWCGRTWTWKRSGGAVGRGPLLLRHHQRPGYPGRSDGAAANDRATRRT